MNNIFVFISLFVAFCYAANGQGKLQIGIKKRVENCVTKTRKGDLVHIHYTVIVVNLDDLRSLKRTDFHSISVYLFL